MLLETTFQGQFFRLVLSFEVHCYHPLRQEEFILGIDKIASFIEDVKTLCEKTGVEAT
jgi:hypothetical protein